MWIAFLIILAVAGPSQEDRILCLFPHPGKSHFMVFQPILESLSNRGHELTVVSFFPAKDPPGNYHDISLVGMSDIYVEVIDFSTLGASESGWERYYEELLIIDVFVNLGLQLCENILHTPAIQEILTYRNDTYDMIIMEYFLGDCALGIASHFDAPIVGLLSHQLLPWHYQIMGVPDNPSYVPSIFNNNPDEHFATFVGRLQNTLKTIMYNIYYRFWVQKKQQTIVEKALGRKIPDLEDIALNTSLILVNTHHSLHGALPTVPGVIEVGGAHLKKSVQPLPQDLNKFIEEAEHGVILFSFGSLLKASTMPKTKLNAFIQTFAKLPQRVIMKCEADIPGKPDNVLLVKWIPQYDILHHSNVVAFIAHGGLLGMTEAVHAGVPMLVVPVLAEQPGNARAAKIAGLAQIVEYRDITEENLQNALKIILTPASRESARALSSVWRDRPMAPLDTAVYWIEKVLRHGSARLQLASPGRRLPFYQRALLDVAAVLLLVVVAAIGIIYLLLSLIINTVYNVLEIDHTNAKKNSKKVKRN